MDLRNNSLRRCPGEPPGVMCGEERRRGELNKEGRRVKERQGEEKKREGRGK